MMTQITMQGLRWTWKSFQNDTEKSFAEYVAWIMPLAEDKLGVKITKILVSYPQLAEIEAMKRDDLVIEASNYVLKNQVFFGAEMESAPRYDIREVGETF